MKLATHLNVMGSLVPIKALKMNGILKDGQKHGDKGAQDSQNTFPQPSLLCLSPEPLCQSSSHSHSPFRSRACSHSMPHFPISLFQLPQLFPFSPQVVEVDLLSHHCYSPPPTHYHIHTPKARSQHSRQGGPHRKQGLERKTAENLMLMQFFFCPCHT